jgi:outer membrane protein OmpA-like peptidoglycan-associated protein
MKCASSFLTGRLTGLLCVLPLALPMLSATVAVAQGGTHAGSRDVLLGSSTLPRGSAVATPAPTVERDAQAFYDQAQRELKLGRTDVAQRQLEQLVARFPGTLMADVARHDLIALYSSRRPTQPSGLRAELPAEQRLAELKPALSSSPKSHLGGPLSSSPSGDVPFITGSIDPASSAWQTKTVAADPARADNGKPADAGKRPVRTAQDQFRKSAGDLVFFSDGSAELGTRARRVLEAQADWLKAQPTARVTIEGHADDTGGPAENQALSAARARAVLERLIEAGIEPARLSVVAVGSARRAADCADAACAAQNRRVATMIVAQSVAALVEPSRTNARSATAGRLPWEQAPVPR